MPRTRSARSAALSRSGLGRSGLGVTVRRIPTTTLGSRNAHVLRRRLIVGGLVFAALVLISLTFRPGADGSLTGAQSAGATALRPFAVGADRVAQPFRDGYEWLDSLLGARSEAERLRAENREMRQRLIQSEFARQENATLRGLLRYIEGPRFPEDFAPVAAEVFSRPPGTFTQAIVIAAGSQHGVQVNDPVVNADGLVGLVTRVTSRSARVQLLTDQQIAVPAIDLRTRAQGIVRHGRGTRETLTFDRVQKEERVRRGDELVTAGWKAEGVESLYPKGVPIGEVTSVGQAEIDNYQQVQVDPYVNFGVLDTVVVLVPLDRP